MAAVKRQKRPQHMHAGRIPIATIHQTELVTAAIAPRDSRGTHTCKALMDAKVTNSSIYAYNSGSYSQYLCFSNFSWQTQSTSDICFVFMWMLARY
jgi:hypothetical protein